MQKLLSALLAATALVAGCSGLEFNDGPDEPAATETERTERSEAESQIEPKPATASSAEPSETESAPEKRDAVMARVNGEPIYMSRLNDLLLRSHGVPTAQQLIALELVRQEAERQGITVTEEDVERQERMLVRRLFPDVKTDQQRKMALSQIRQQNDVSEPQWRIIVRRNAYQTALAEPRVEVTEEDLEEAFARKYEQKARVRHIQVGSLQQAQQVLEKLEDGADFAELAREVSTNASRTEGGLLPPLGPHTEGVPMALRKAALALDEPGQISDPVQVMTTFHVIKLEEILEPEDVELTDVRDELTEEVRLNKLERVRQQILASLISEAQSEGRIKYVNPFLKANVRETTQGARP